MTYQEIGYLHFSRPQIELGYRGYVRYLPSNSILFPYTGDFILKTIINPRRACAARVTVLGLFECHSLCHCVTVSDTTLQASVVKGTLKFRHQRSVNDTLQCFDSWILQTMLGSRDMAKFGASGLQGKREREREHGNGKTGTGKY